MVVSFMTPTETPNLSKAPAEGGGELDTSPLGKGMEGVREGEDSGIGRERVGGKEGVRETEGERRRVVYGGKVGWKQGRRV